jgi:hypothetical protein
MLSVVSGAVALALALVTGGDPFTASVPVLDSPTRHVRAADRAARKLLRAGFHHSPTFASLLQRLERADLLVYVETVSRLPGALEGRLVIQPPSHGFRYVRIQIAERGTPNDTIAVLGHELRHAVEVAEAREVVDADGLAALYRRIGIAHGNNLFDTIEAQETGRQVMKELIA